MDTTSFNYHEVIKCSITFNTPESLFDGALWLATEANDSLHSAMA